MYTYQIIASAPEHYILRNLDVEKYRSLIAKIIELEGGATPRYFKANSILLQVLSELFDDVHFDERCWGKTNIADEIKFYLDVNYSEKLQIQEIAHMFGTHPNYLTRIFHEKYNVMPKQYLQGLKLKKACNFLATTDFPVSIISSAMGFDDQLAFSKTFRKTYSVSPTEYRYKSKETQLNI